MGDVHLTAVSTPPPGRAPRNFFSVVSPLVQQFLLSKRFIKENLGGTETTTTTRHADDETTHRQTGLRHTPDRLATRDRDTQTRGDRRVGGCRGSGLTVGDESLPPSHTGCGQFRTDHTFVAVFSPRTEY